MLADIGINEQCCEAVERVSNLRDVVFRHGRLFQYPAAAFYAQHECCAAYVLPIVFRNSKPSVLYRFVGFCRELTFAKDRNLYREMIVPMGIGHEKSSASKCSKTIQNQTIRSSRSPPSLDARIFLRALLPVCLECHHITLEEHLTRRRVLTAQLSFADEFFDS